VCWRSFLNGGISTLNLREKPSACMAPNGAPGLERQLLLDVLSGSLRRNSTREDGRLVIAGSMESIMNFIIRSLIKLGILKKDIDYHLLRALMVMICLFFGKWAKRKCATHNLKRFKWGNRLQGIRQLA
jgi:hypothetical protein